MKTPSVPQYRGRFAPSPTGPLHFGSLVAAVGSYLDAKHHQGEWLVRIEDLDMPRVAPGATETILATLMAFGMVPDGPIVKQTERTESYHAAMHALRAMGLIYPCACSRKEIADSSIHAQGESVYTGKCRNGIVMDADRLSAGGRSTRRDACLNDSPTTWTLVARHETG